MYVRACTPLVVHPHCSIRCTMLHQPVPCSHGVHSHNHTPTYLHAYTHTHLHTHTHTCIHTHTHSYTPTYIHTPSHLHTYTQHTPTPTHTPSHLHCHTHLYTFSDPQISPKTQTHSQMSLVISYLCGSTFVNMTRRMSYHVAPFRSSTKPCRCPRQWQTAHYWLEVGSQQ